MFLKKTDQKCWQQSTKKSLCEHNKVKFRLRCEKICRYKYDMKKNNLVKANYIKKQQKITKKKRT